MQHLHCCIWSYLSFVALIIRAVLLNYKNKIAPSDEDRLHLRLKFRNRISLPYLVCIWLSFISALKTVMKNNLVRIFVGEQVFYFLSKTQLNGLTICIFVKGWHYNILSVFLLLLLLLLFVRMRRAMRSCQKSIRPSPPSPPSPLSECMIDWYKWDPVRKRTFSLNSFDVTPSSALSSKTLYYNLDNLKRK